MRESNSATNQLYRIVIIILSFPCFVSAQDCLRYEIKPVFLEHRINLEISVQFKMKKNDSIAVRLISDYYGTPDIYKYITSFIGKNGTNVIMGEEEQERIVRPNSKGDISLAYTISYDPKKLEGSAFGPVIHQDYFSVAGCQWLLHIGDDEQKRKFLIKLRDTPKDWITHSSIGRNAKKLKIYASYNELISARIGGGGKSHQFYVKKKPVLIVVKGNFDIPTQNIFSAVERIVKLQRSWFKDYDQPFYQVVINERDDVIAGTALKNQFVCFVGSTTSQNDLNIILAHEMFHNWLPHRIEIFHKAGEKVTAGNYQADYEWISEGFTTYFAKKMLLDEGLISASDFVELVNEEIIDIEDSFLKTTPYPELASAKKNKNYTWRHKKLAYWRGALIAFKWESQLQNAPEKRSLSDFIRALYKYASGKNGKISERDFFDFSKNFGIDAIGDFEKYIIKGEPILLEKELFAGINRKFKLTEVDFQTFDPGFDFIETERVKKIVGLKKGSPAYRAGLRDGMKYVKSRGTFRNKGWSEERPMITTVIVNGETKSIEFVPYGVTIKLQQIIPKG